MNSDPMNSLDLTKLLAARHLATRACPYLADALHAMRVVSSPSVLTMGVDRYWRCYAAPAFVAATPVGELAGAWLHEVAHLLRDHHGRARRLQERSRSEQSLAHGYRSRPLLDVDHERREQLRLNLAMDCEINDDLLDDLPDDLPDDLDPRDRVRLPADCVTPARLGLSPALLFEQYLDALPPAGWLGRMSWLDCGSGAHDGDAPWELGPGGAHPLSDTEAAAIRYRVADHIHRRAGRAPHGWRRWADGVTEPEQDWRQILRAVVRQALTQASGSMDYTYRRPGRRANALRRRASSTGSQVVTPSLVQYRPRVAIVIDTSGSVADTELGVALGETAGILTASGTAANQVSVYCCDSAVHTAESVCSAMQITLAGGGGTDLTKGISRAMAGRPRPDVVVVITDGHTPWPQHPPAARVIAGLLGPPPQLDENGQWFPPPPPAWIQSVRLGSTRA